jgi:hypothetical protein
MASIPFTLNLNHISGSLRKRTTQIYNRTFPKNKGTISVRYGESNRYHTYYSALSSIKLNLQRSKAASSF